MVEKLEEGRTMSTPLAGPRPKPRVSARRFRLCLLRCYRPAGTRAGWAGSTATAEASEPGLLQELFAAPPVPGTALRRVEEKAPRPLKARRASIAFRPALNWRCG